MSNEKPSGLLAGYLTRPQLAAELNRTIRTLERWEWERTGPAVTHIGKSPLYKIESVRAWLASLERPQVREKSSRPRRRRVTAPLVAAE
jgi:hypothetical protein